MTIFCLVYLLFKESHDSPDKLNEGHEEGPKRGSAQVVANQPEHALKD